MYQLKPGKETLTGGPFSVVKNPKAEGQGLCSKTTLAGQL